VLIRVEDGDRRAPLAALLFLVGLLLGAGSGTNVEASLRDAGARLAQSSKAPVHVLPGGRAVLSDDEDPRPELQSSLPPSPPAIVSDLSAATAQQQSAAPSLAPRHAPSSGYRARAPPAA
jgi:hypothetical protein